MSLAPRRASRLPIVPRPETDELLSSWLKRTAGAYGTNAGALLAQLGSTETDPETFDWAAGADDLQNVAVALGTSTSDITQRSFAGITRPGLMFISTGAPAKTCAPCQAEFVRRGLATVVLQRWKVAVALHCARCDGPLTSVLKAQSGALSGLPVPEYLEEVRNDVFHIVGMAIYDRIEAPVTERLFRAVSTPIRRPRSPLGAQKNATLGSGPALMWRTIDMKPMGLAGTRPLFNYRSNFAAWPEFVQAAAAASARQMATAPAATWVDLKKMRRVLPGDTKIARRLFRA